MYEYKFETVAITNGIRESQDNNIGEVEKLIEQRAKEGYRFVQVVVVPYEKSGMYRPSCYKVIFEREV